jgi:hypothetical protein
MLGDERGEAGDHLGRAADGEHQVGAFLEGGGPQLVQALPLGLGERAGHTRESGAPPERESLVYRGQGASHVTGGTPESGGAEALLELL